MSNDRYVVRPLDADGTDIELMTKKEAEILHRRLDLLTQHSRTSFIQERERSRRHDRRVQLTAHTKGIIRTVTQNAPFNGVCPCCCVRDVLSEGKTASGAQFDHFYGPAHAQPEFAWLICEPCHNKLDRSVPTRADMIPRFCDFQAHVTEFLFSRKLLLT